VFRPFCCLALRLQHFLVRFLRVLGRPFLVLPGRFLRLLRAVRAAVDLSLTRHRPGKSQDNQYECRNSFHCVLKMESPKLRCLLSLLLPSVFHKVLITASAAIRGKLS